jgi:hypothetical protein
MRGYECQNRFFPFALGNHIRSIIKNPNALVPDEEKQRIELRKLMDSYVDERIELKLKELGVTKPR